MTDSLGNLNLPLEAGKDVGVRNNVWKQDLDSNEFVEGGLTSQKHHPKPASTELTHYLVASQQPFTQLRNQFFEQ